MTEPALSLEDMIIEHWGRMRGLDSETSLIEATADWLERHELDAEDVSSHLSSAFKETLRRQALERNMLEEKLDRKAATLDLL